jgi:probable rRNA maturation factor
MIVNCQRRIPLSIAPLAKFCEEVRQALRFPSDGVTVRLVSDPVIARLNHDFRGKLGPTDVLSFPAKRRPPRISRTRNHARPRRTGAGLDQEYVGDIAISPQTARRNARRAARTLSAELRVLILHGMIHLAGYDHETDHGEMDRFERRMRRRLGLL